MLKKLVPWRIEPTTSALLSRRFNQLSERARITESFYCKESEISNFVLFKILDIILSD